MTTLKKIVLVVGPTGHGKSSIVSEYAVGEKPVIGHSIESETTETKSYPCNVAGEEVIIYDTPGLGDTEKRDQVCVLFSSSLLVLIMFITEVSN